MRNVTDKLKNMDSKKIKKQIEQLKQKPEVSVESKLNLLVRKHGGKCIKLNSPGLSGMTDRLVLMDFGEMWFVELKAPGGRLSKLQLTIHKMLSALGYRVRVIWNDEQLKEFDAELLNLYYLK